MRFLRNHAKAIIACDFVVAVSVTLQLLCIFMLNHHRSRRLQHRNVTAHPTTAWTLQRLREAIGFGKDNRYLLHDRDSSFARHLDASIEGFELRVRKSTRRSPMAKAICERLIGTMRRECLDWVIPISEAHHRSLLKVWVAHKQLLGSAHGLGIRRARPAIHDCRIPLATISVGTSRGPRRALEISAGQATS